MDSYQTPAILAIIPGAGWASGINLCGAAFVSGNPELRPELRPELPQGVRP